MKRMIRTMAVVLLAMILFSPVQALAAGFNAKIQGIHGSKVVESFCEIFGFDHLCLFPFFCM